MANFGFSKSVTPVNLFKLVSKPNQEWTPEQQILAYTGAALGELSSNQAKAVFISTLNTLGIFAVDYHSKVNGIVNVQVFNGSGEKTKTLSENDKRKALALAYGWEVDDFVILSKVTGTKLDLMYAEKCIDTSGENAPFSLYQIMIGVHTIYRVTNEVISFASLGHQALKYLIDQKKLPEQEFGQYLIKDK